ncbi:alternate-type signal peptide domain-containing protein [Microbacterium sp. NPDC055521]
MNKTTKGTIAVAAAIALLMGGAGTLAYWQDSATAAAATITTGKLDVEIPKGCEWKVTNSGASATINKIADFRMVPGDTVTCTVGFSTLATGDNLQAKAEIDWAGHGELPAEMVATASGTYNNATINALSFDVAKGAAGGQFLFSLNWPLGTTPSQAGMGKQIDLAAATVTVSQK